MDFNLSEEHLMIQKAARDFAQQELLPGVIERDEKEIFPAEQIKKMGALGFMGMMVDPEYGGSGLDTISYVIAMEEMSKVDASASVVMSVNNSFSMLGFANFWYRGAKTRMVAPIGFGRNSRCLLLK
jgi:alkylation response protein AidB-like acyl-CoA dehydrogenase